MDQHQDQHVIFQELLTGSLEKIKSLLPKKYIEFRRLIEKSLDQINEIKDDKSRFDVNANKYFIIYKMGIETKQIKVIECCLYDIEKLVSHGFLDGYSYDYAQNICLEESNKPKQYKKINRMLIDTIIESICSCQSEQEDSVQLQLIKILQTMLVSPRCKIHQETLLLCLTTLINIFNSQNSFIVLDTRSSSIVSASRGTLSRAIDYVFKQCRNNTQLSNEQNEALIKKCKYIPQDMMQSDKRYQYNQQDDSPSSKLSKLVQNDESNKILEHYTKRVLSNMVDDVCLYYAKLEQNPDVPIRSVPLYSESEDIKYKNYIQVKIPNESDIPSGKFGWCIICRNTAPFFCKDTRVPICSVDCKKKHFEETEIAQKICQIYSKVQVENPYFEDARLLFKHFCQLSMGDNQYLKERILALEMLHHLVGDYMVVFLGQKDLLQCIQTDLMGSILHNAVETEKAFYILSYGIFIFLVYYYRDVLRSQIEGLIDHLFFKVLDSPQITIQQKIFTIKIFENILLNSAITLELFINHDCSIGNSNIIQQIIECLAKVVQGKYNKSETTQDHYSLRVQSQQILKTFIDNLINFIDDINQEEVYNDSPQRSEESNTTSEIKELMRKLESHDNVERQRALKLHNQQAIQKFNIQPSNCFSYLLSLGLLQADSAKDYALFIKNQKQLSKQKIGEYFGNPKEFNQKVLFEYTQTMNFKSINIVESLREYLASFNLPPESQQIDRVVEIFANKYLTDNKRQFKSADAAYTFTYLLIMFQTDRYNPNVTDKMSLKDFSKLAKGINDGDDIPQETLKDIFDSICQEPLALHEKDEQRSLSQSVKANFKYRLDAFKKETEKLISLLLHNKKQKHPIFSTYLYQAVSTLSCFLNSYGDQSLLQSVQPFREVIVVTWRLIQQLIVFYFIHEGAISMIQILSRLVLHQERETFLQLICNLSALNSIGSMKQKNFKALKSLILLATLNGNCLRNSWRPALEIVSILDKLESDKSNLKFYQEDYQNDVRMIFSLFEIGQIDQLMGQTINLDPLSILDFIQALIEVSNLEISDDQQLRVFSLQRLVDVASFNMDRIRLTWSKIWEMLKKHFITVGKHPNVQVALYAIDQLKQLSIKFLQKQELAQFHFQKEFLEPFEIIFQEVEHNEIKEFILSCITMLTNCCFVHLKSGWRVIISIILKALNEEIEQFTELSIIDTIFLENLQLVFEVFGDLQQVVNKLLKNNDPILVAKAIDYLKVSVDYLFINEDQNTLFEEYWYQSIANLSVLFRDEKEDIQQKSISTFFDLLKKNGSRIKFSSSIWSQIIKGTIKDLFHAVNDSLMVSRGYKQDAARQLCILALQGYQELIIQQSNILEHAFQESLNILCWNICSGHENLAKNSFITLRSILQHLGSHLSITNWSYVLKIIDQIFDQRSPKEIVEAYKLNPVFDISFEELLSEGFEWVDIDYDLNQQQSIFHCIIQLMILDLILDISQFLDSVNINQALNILDGSYMQAKKFNQQILVRVFLQKRGLMAEQNKLPGLLKQEKQALQTIFTVIGFRQVDSEAFTIEFTKRAIKLIKECSNQIKTFEIAKSAKEFNFYYQGNQEYERIKINNLSIVNTHVLPFLIKVNIEILNPYISDLLLDLVMLPQCYSILAAQCPHCQQCPYECSFKSEWKELLQQTQNLQIRLINYLLQVS